MRHSFTALLASLLLVGTAGAGAVTVVEAPAAAAPQPARPPNILLITTDDQHVADLDYMPITRQVIGSQGVTFTDALSTDPLCCPARAVLATGLFNHNNGVTSNHGVFGGYQALANGEFATETVPTWLNRTDDGHDYESAFVGKFLNGYGAGQADGEPHPVPEGWDYFAAGLEGSGLYDSYGGSVNVLDRTAGEEEATVRPTELYRTFFNTETVIDRIEHAVGEVGNRSDDKPFFIWQSELAPHGACWPTADGNCAWGPPMWAPEDDGTFLDVPFRPGADPSFDERVVSDKPSHIQGLSDWTATRIGRAKVYDRARVRSLQSVDRSVGRIVGRLEELGQLDNTVIIFTSDNGHLNGEHRFKGKSVPYEPSLRVPLLMRGPGIPAGKVVTETTALVDIPATIAALAGATPTLERNGKPVPLDGRSLVPVANGAPGWSAIPIEAGAPSATTPDVWWYRGVRTSRYTYAEFEQTGEAELYDRLVDPYQLDNVAYRPTHAATRRALAEKLDRLRGCGGTVCRGESGDGVPEPLSDGTPVHPDELGSIGAATQVVTMTGSSWGSTRGKLVAWRKVGRSWQVVGQPFSVRFGSHGLVRPGRARHLRGKTPAGTFAPAFAMGLQRNPGTALRYRRLDGNDHWPYDRAQPASYNVFQPVRSKQARWSKEQSVRWASSPRRYGRALVLEHNLPRVIYRSRYNERLARIKADVRRGSFVVHTGSRAPEQGWVTMHPDRMRWLLRWIDPSQRTAFVVGTPGYLKSDL